MRHEKINLLLTSIHQKSTGAVVKIDCIAFTCCGIRCLVGDWNLCANLVLAVCSCNIGRINMPREFFFYSLIRCSRASSNNLRVSPVPFTSTDDGVSFRLLPIFFWSALAFSRLNGSSLTEVDFAADLDLLLVLFFRLQIGFTVSFDLFVLVVSFFLVLVYFFIVSCITSQFTKKNSAEPVIVLVTTIAVMRHYKM